MTLVIGLGNSDYMLQVSDRRLTINGRPADEESCKGGALVCENARFAFGFSGIARVRGLVIRKWIMDTLMASGPPDFTAKGILDRFSVRASEGFCSKSHFRGLSSSDKRLSILFSGYLYSDNPPRAAFAFVSNYQDFARGRDHLEPWDEFRVTYQHEKRPYDGKVWMVQRIGAWQAMPEKDIRAFQKMLEDGKPVAALVGKTVECLRRISGTVRTVGKQISWIAVPRDLSRPPRSGYESDVNVQKVRLPSYVEVLRRGSWACDEPFIRLVNGTRPVAVKKVARNAPCPCGSGKKYKYCHGRWLITWGLYG